MGIDGVVGEVITTAGSSVSAQFVGETIDVVLGNLDGTVFNGLADGLFFERIVDVTHPDGTLTQEVQSIDVQTLVVNALAAYAGSRLAGEVIEAESETAGIFGSIGSALGTAVGAGQLLTSTAIGNLFVTGGALAGPLGIAIGAFVGTVVGTLAGNVFGSDDDEPSAWANSRYDYNKNEYEVSGNWAHAGGDAAIAANMVQQVVDGINNIIASTHGILRHGSKAPNLQIGYEGNEFIVSVGGSQKSFATPADAIMHGAFKALKSFDLVGGHAVVMRAWHNTEATTLHELLEDLEVAEAFQSYLVNPIGILALMMDQPESNLAQSWAAILQRAAELELHLPHEKDLDGGWGEILLAQGIDPTSIPDLSGDTLTIVDPVTGEETVLHHIIGPGYEIVRIEGTDGNDIIEVIVDGPSITYVDAGAGDDIVEGTEQADILYGNTGDDTLNGYGGNDWLHGGQGDDTIDGGAGDDLVIGGRDSDYLIGGADTDHIYGNAGDDTLIGMSGRLAIWGSRQRYIAWNYWE